MTEEDRIDDDTPMTLDEACRVIFRGTISKASLRAEATRGNLIIERIGRRDFVTARAIKEMRKKCRVQQKAPASTYEKTGASGSSETASISSARDAALLNAKKLKSNLLDTSRASTNRGGTAAN